MVNDKYPGFTYTPLVLTNGEVKSTWMAKFSNSHIVAVGDKFYSYYKRNYQAACETIQEAMDIIKHRSIIDFFDEK